VRDWVRQNRWLDADKAVAGPNSFVVRSSKSSGRIPSDAMQKRIKLMKKLAAALSVLSLIVTAIPSTAKENDENRATTT